MRSLVDAFDAVDRDLNVEVVNAGQSLRRRFVDARAIRGEFDAHVLVDRVFHQLEEVIAHHWFAAADVDVENLHGGDLVDQRLRFSRRQFHRVATSR